MNCDVSASGPGAATGTNALHVASGVAVLPVRTPIATPVPAGAVAAHAMLCQSTGVVASKTRDTNVPTPA